MSVANFQKAHSSVTVETVIEGISYLALVYKEEAFISAKVTEHFQMLGRTEDSSIRSYSENILTVNG